MNSNEDNPQALGKSSIVHTLYTEVPELQRVPQPKSIAPPPTAQTSGPN